MAAEGRRSNGEGSVSYDRSKERWVARVDQGRDPTTGRRRQKKVGLYASEPEAREGLRRALTHQEEGRLPTGAVPSLDQWMTYFFEVVAPESVDSWTIYSSYEPTYRLHAKPVLGTRRIDKLEPEDFERLYAGMRRKDLAPATILKMHRILSRALKIAERRRKIPRNPCSLIDGPSLKRPEVVPYTLDQARRVLRVAVEHPNGARWSLALAVGCRQGEALGLTWPLLDLENAVVGIRWQLRPRGTYKHGCPDPRTCGPHRVACQPRCRHKSGNCPKPCPPDCAGHAKVCPQRVGGGLHLKPTKSERSRRSLELPARLVVMLAEHRKRQLEQRLLLGSAYLGSGLTVQEGRREVPAELVFCQPNGRPIWANQDMAEWEQILAAAGVERAGTHVARHTAATIMLEQRIDVKVVQEILGHSSSTLTRDTYQHVVPAIARGAADKIDRALFGDTFGDTLSRTGAHSEGWPEWRPAP